MDASVECTHCRVVMTSWSAAGSPIRYYQCPFCQRTHSSLYGEVFARRAGARVLDAKPRAPSASTGIPMASQEDVRWAGVKATAARWFARLEADGRQREAPAPRPARRVNVAGAAAPVGRVNAVVADADGPAEIPDADPADVVEVAAVANAVRGT